MSSSTILERAPGESASMYAFRLRSMNVALAESSQRRAVAQGMRPSGGVPVPAAALDDDPDEQTAAPELDDTTRCSGCGAPTNSTGKYTGQAGSSALTCPHCGAGVTFDDAAADDDPDESTPPTVSARAADGSPRVLRELQRAFLRERRKRLSEPIL